MRWLRNCTFAKVRFSARRSIGRKESKEYWRGGLGSKDNPKTVADTELGLVSENAARYSECWLGR